jgi:hypothetical protein
LRAPSGLGLGLSLVREMVQAHGGTVGAESPGEGHGSTFTVTLPLTIPGRPRSSDSGSADRDHETSASRAPVGRTGSGWWHADHLRRVRGDAVGPAPTMRRFERWSGAFRCIRVCTSHTPKAPQAGVTGEPSVGAKPELSSGRGLPASSPSANPVGDLEAFWREPAHLPATSFQSR